MGHWYWITESAKYDSLLSFLSLPLGFSVQPGKSFPGRCTKLDKKRLGQLPKKLKILIIILQLIVLKGYGLHRHKYLQLYNRLSKNPYVKTSVFRWQMERGPQS